MYLEMNNGIRITNLISYGPNNELLLTYTFANGSEFHFYLESPSGFRVSGLVD
jgi:hypothetical protein